LDEIKSVPQEIFDSIDMAKQMRKMTYAIDHVMAKKYKI
jgi:hypothetical protein